MLENNEAWSVTQLLKNNAFTGFGTPHVIISDWVSHFCNHSFDSLFAKYRVKHTVGSPYHSQPNEKGEVSNQEIKRIWPKL